MTQIVDLSELVDQAHKWNSTDRKILDQEVISVPAKQGEMLDLGPLLSVDSSCNQGLIFIDTHCNDPHIFPPYSFILLQHFLIVLHWFLARPAPSCPNIDQQNLSWSVFQHRFSLIKDVVKLSIIFEDSTNRQSLRNISRDSKLIDLGRDGIKFFRRNILTDTSFNEVSLLLDDVRYSWPLLNYVDDLLFKSSELLSLVVLEDLDDLFH